MLKSRRLFPEVSDLEYATVYTRLRKIFKGIKARCDNKHDLTYGGRGVECRFRSAKDFIAYVITLPYKKGLSIDRIDNNGHYEKGNVKWSTQKEQNCNQRRNVLIEGKALSSVVATLSGEEYYAGILYHVKRGDYTTVTQIQEHIQRNRHRRDTEQRIKGLLLARKDFTYESIRAFIKQGLSDEEIISRKKWGGCGVYARL